MAQARGIQDTGLSVVYEPSGTVPIVDIVFVHGLRGRPFKTWATEHQPAKTSSEKLDKSPNIALKSIGSLRRSLRPLSGRFKSHQENRLVFWPEDLLPEKCPDARILTWGYDSVVANIKSSGGRTNKNGIFSHAKDLLFSLKRQRPLGRRTILVAHSLGGIVVKEMLSMADVSEDAAVKDIVCSIAGVVFLGTPHRGSSRMASLGDTVRQAASSILRLDTSSHTIQALGLQSDDLERCQDAFARIWSAYDFKVKTFQEGLPLTGLNIGLLNQKLCSLGSPIESASTIHFFSFQDC
ncbi:hypothetical protein B0T22DRAFT_300246 [Podospora appendiculata]|uniref:GPI inositol-deacylase n=1 Tax=Podospora appendiculata TaxID=314037 RepID=A0AAE1C7P1_9PEZI|nr:hypothetical protein B0T22DRAFT_300246 [Podospora appendiculata]